MQDRITIHRGGMGADTTTGLEVQKDIIRTTLHDHQGISGDRTIGMEVINGNVATVLRLSFVKITVGSTILMLESMVMGGDMAEGT